MSATIDDLANLYDEKLKTASAESYQLALLDLIFHELETVAEELQFIGRQLASQ